MFPSEAFFFRKNLVNRFLSRICEALDSGAAFQSWLVFIIHWLYYNFYTCLLHAAGDDWPFFYIRDHTFLGPNYISTSKFLETLPPARHNLLFFSAGFDHSPFSPFRVGLFKWYLQCKWFSLFRVLFVSVFANIKINYFAKIIFVLLYFLFYVSSHTFLYVLINFCEPRICLRLFWVSFWGPLLCHTFFCSFPFVPSYIFYTSFCFLRQWISSHVRVS